MSRETGKSPISRAQDSVKPVSRGSKDKKLPVRPEKCRFRLPSPSAS